MCEQTFASGLGSGWFQKWVVGLVSVGGWLGGCLAGWLGGC